MPREQYLLGVGIRPDFIPDVKRIRERNQRFGLHQFGLESQFDFRYFRSLNGTNVWARDNDVGLYAAFACSRQHAA